MYLFILHTPHGVASIEADVFLVDGELYVAHKENEINKARNSGIFI